MVGNGSRLPQLVTACLTKCKLSNTSHFSNDLGLDSLDTVEVVMAIEEVSCSMVGKCYLQSDFVTGVQH